jgi:mRNA interferase MazF
MAKRKPIVPKRGEVFLVAFDPTLGAEIQKRRPALILQNDIGNKHSPLTIVAAITSNTTRQGPICVLVRKPEGGLDVDSVILLNQIRTIDGQRLIKRLGALRPETMRHVEQSLMISLGLVEL